MLVSVPALLQVSGQTPVGLLSFHHLHAVIGLQLLHLARHTLYLVDTSSYSQLFCNTIEEHSNLLHLLSGADTLLLVLQNAAVEFVHELLDLRQLSLDQLQADDRVNLFIVLALQRRDVFGELRQPSLQTQHHGLQVISLQLADFVYCAALIQ